MPAKIARLATRPLFWIPEVSVAVRSSRPSCSKAEKREYSWQIGSHPGNPGFKTAIGRYDDLVCIDIRERAPNAVKRKPKQQRTKRN